MDQAREAAHAVTEFFQGNPFASTIGRMIEQATDPTLPSENWALNIEICDAINTLPEGPRDAVRAIRKRLQMAMGKNNSTVMYTLTVLETCVKNCDARFHHLIAQKEFVQDLVKLIGPKFDPPQLVQEKVLSLIQSWADAFRGLVDYKGVVEIYDDLKSKGIEFPMTDMDTMAPIITPQRSVPETIPPPPVQRQQPPTSSPRGAAPAPHSVPAPAVVAGPVNPSPEQLAKLRNELDIVNGNIKVLREMLAELHPGKEDPEDFQLLQQLYQTCKSMQHRLVELLQRVANEEVTSELLMINDEMNNVFSKYERYISHRNQPENQGLSSARPSATTTTAAKSEGDAPLIDFGGDNSKQDLSAQLAGMSVNATSRLSDVPHAPMGHGGPAAAGRQGGSNYQDNTMIDQLDVGLGTAAQQRGGRMMDENNAPKVQDKEQEIAEMEAWLKANPGAVVPNAEETSEEFDNFLAQRAAAAEQLPKKTNENKNANEKDKKDEEEKMFAL